MSDKLKPCPFCGREGVVYTIGKKEYIGCSAAHFVRTPAPLWNARPVEDELSAKIEQLEIQNRELTEILIRYALYPIFEGALNNGDER